MSLPFLVAVFGEAYNEIVEMTGVNALSSSIGSSSGNRPQVSIKILGDGTIDEATGDTGSALSYSQTGRWLTPGPDVQADWECKYEINSEDVGDPGTFTGMTVSTWTDCNTDPVVTWTKDGTDLGTASANITIYVREKADTNNTDNASIQMDCEIFNDA